MTRPLISLGDALTAFHHLEPSDRGTARDILGLLRLNLPDELSTSLPSVGAFTSSANEVVRTAHRHSGVTQCEIPPVEPTAPTRLPDAPVAANATQSILRKHAREPSGFARPRWLGESATPDAPAQPNDLPGNTPLFSRVQRRGLLTSAISTLVDEGEVDVDEFVDMYCATLAVEDLPRLVTRTTRRGVQILRDRSLGLHPFADDQRQLIEALDDILDDRQFEHFEFIGCPSRGILVDGSDDVARWTPPPKGTPIVLLTDLGIGGPRSDTERASPAEWLSFTRLARAQGHRLLALVPYAPDRWPPRVARMLPVLHWSERTTVAQIRRATRNAHDRTTS